MWATAQHNRGQCLYAWGGNCSTRDYTKIEKKIISTWAFRILQLWIHTHTHTEICSANKMVITPICVYWRSNEDRRVACWLGAAAFPTNFRAFKSFWHTRARANNARILHHNYTMPLILLQLYYSPRNGKSIQWQQLQPWNGSRPSTLQHLLLLLHTHKSLISN